MKKILKIMIVAILLSFAFMPVVNAFEFDNVFSNYDEETKTVTVSDSLYPFPIETTKVVDIKLNSEIHHIMFDKKDYAFELEVTNYELTSYKNFVTKMETYNYFNLAEGKQGGFTYKYWDENAGIEVDDYEESCSTDANNTKTCEMVKTGSHTEYTGNWVNFDGDLPTGTTKIRAYWTGSLTEKERIEWIPTFAGVRIEEWADFGVVNMPEYHERDSDDSGCTTNSSQSFQYGALSGDLGDQELVGFGMYAKMGGLTNCTFEIWNSDATGLPTTYAGIRNSSDNGEHDCSYLSGGATEYWYNTTIPSGFTMTNGSYYAIVFYYAGTTCSFSRQAEDGFYPYGKYAYNFIDGNRDMAFQIFSQDITDYPPEVTIPSPANNTNSTDTGLDILIEVTDDNAVTSEKWSSNSGETNNSLTVGANITSEVWTYGDWNITVYVEDVSGGTNSTSVSFNIYDTSLELNSPDNETNSTTGSFTFEGNATASDGLTVYELYLNGVVNETISLSGETGYNGSQTIVDIEDGMHQNWSIRINDSNYRSIMSGNRTFSVDVTVPSINITSPYNNTNTTDESPDILVDAFDLTSGIKEIVYFNDSGEFNTTLAEGQNITNQNWSLGTHTVVISAEDYLGNIDRKAVTFIVDVLPSIQFDSPANNTVTNTSEQNLSITAEDDLGLKNGTLWVFNATDESLWNSTDFDFTGNPLTATIGTIINFVDGVWKWMYSITHITGDEVSQSENRSLTVDTLTPEVSLIYPTGSQSISVSITSEANTTVEINYTVSDENLDACIFYNGTGNETLTCGNNITTSLVFDTYTFILFVNDTAGNVNTTEFEVTYDFGIRENNQSFPDSAIEGNVDIFTINITTNGSQPSEVNLNYNNTNFLATTITNIGGNNYSISRTLQIPETDVDLNVTFFWDINLQDGTSGNSSSNTLPVFAMTADACTANDVLILNYTHKDEDLQILITNNTHTNNTIEVDVAIYPVGSTQAILNYTANFSSGNPQICLAPDFTNGTEYRMDSTVRYDTEHHVSEFNMIRNFVLKNDTIPQNIDLFDLVNSRSQEFLLTYKDDNFLPQKDIIIDVTRNYIEEGLFKTVEKPITDNDGQALVHLVLSEVLYTIIAKDTDGNILAILDNFVAVCEEQGIGNCRINMNQIATTVDPDDFSTLGDIRATESFDLDSRTISVTFTSVSEGVKTVSINTTLFDRFGNQTVCSQQLTSTSGTLTCTIPVTFGNQTVESKIYSDGTLVGNARRDLENPSETFGSTGVIIAIMLFWIITMMFITSPIGIIIGAIVAVFLGLGMFLFSGGSILGAGSSFVWILVAAIIIIWRIMKSEAPS